MQFNGILQTKNALERSINICEKSNQTNASALCIFCSHDGVNQKLLTCSTCNDWYCIWLINLLLLCFLKRFDLDVWERGFWMIVCYYQLSRGSIILRAYMVKLPKTSYLQKYFWKVLVVCVWSIHLKSVFFQYLINVFWLVNLSKKCFECQITKKRRYQGSFFN